MDESEANEAGPVVPSGEDTCPECQKPSPHGAVHFFCPGGASVKEQERARSKAGQATARMGYHFNAGRNGPYALETGQDAVKVAQDVLNDLSLCSNSPNRASAAVAVLRSFLEGLRLGELEARIIALEKQSDGVYK